MIRDLSLTLQALLDDSTLSSEFPELESAAISFERPTDTFAPVQSTINLFLFDIHENVELRSNEPLRRYQDGRVLTVPPPRRIACSYLVTAWPVGGADLNLQEHRLLSQTLQVISRHPSIPAGYLQGSLAGQEPPLPMLAPQADGLKNASEFWTAMGSQWRAAFALSATIAMDVFPVTDDAQVTTTSAGFGIDGTAEIRTGIGGRVLGGGAAPVAGALVDLVAAGQLRRRTTTDGDGRFVLPRIAAGTHDLRLTAVGFQPLLQTVTIPGPSDSYTFTLTPL